MPQVDSIRLLCHCHQWQRRTVICQALWPLTKSAIENFGAILSFRSVLRVRKKSFYYLPLASRQLRAMEFYWCTYYHRHSPIFHFQMRIGKLFRGQYRYQCQSIDCQEKNVSRAGPAAPALCSLMKMASSDGALKMPDRKRNKDTWFEMSTACDDWPVCQH